MRYGHVWFGMAGKVLLVEFGRVLVRFVLAGMASPGVVSCAVDGSGVVWLARLGMVVLSYGELSSGLLRYGMAGKARLG